MTNSIYYFNPFIIEPEAKFTPVGYIEDLGKEGTKASPSRFKSASKKTNCS
ncbi:MULTISPECIES: DUF1816 domain-containing protein [unclassified Trichocoleus]|uniref:DUF1816 domain-containing protein n=1 Tax=Funiculus sociatus TaxID=450527 RepID=UPI001689BED8|nr:DUF1816 domain-containing protein [Trichocoleus sp. FACHB-832]MBD2060719.1 DUF1816 domain-containing protein [Trichocoleus sp. FACHB-6]